MADIDRVLDYRYYYHDDTSGLRCITGWHVIDGNGDPTIDNLHDLAESAGSTTLKDKFKAALRTNWILDSLVVRQVQDPQAPGNVKLEYIRPIGEAGTLATGTESPHAATAIMALKTDVASRRARGRMWMPPAMSQGTVSGDRWVTAAGGWWNKLQDFSAEYQHTLQSDGASHYGGGWTGFDSCIYSRAARAANAANFFFRVRAHQLDPRIRWLRSRVPRP